MLRIIFSQLIYPCNITLSLNDPIIPGCYHLREDVGTFRPACFTQHVGWTAPLPAAPGTLGSSGAIA